MQSGVPSRTEGGAADQREDDELAAAAARARLRVEVAKQNVRLAKEEMKRARKRYKEAKREAKRARRRAAAARKAFKRSQRKSGRRASGKPKRPERLAGQAPDTRRDRTAPRKSRARRAPAG